MTIAELIKRLEKFGLDEEVLVPHSFYNGSETNMSFHEPVLLTTENGNVLLLSEWDIDSAKREMGGLTEAELEAKPKRTFEQLMKEMEAGTFTGWD